MTNVERSDDVGRVLEDCRHIFLDFDGPVCSIFGGVGAPSVAARLRDLLAESIPLPEELTQVDDPLEILRFTASLPAGFTERVERELRSAEITAARSARPTPAAEEFMMAGHSSGRTITIVSNNSEAGVQTYLTERGLSQHVDLVVARSQPDPALMKPSPHLLLKAVAELGAVPAECALVGDSVTDVHAAQAAGVRSVGYANKPGKAEQLLRVGADGIITTMADLAAAVRASPARLPSEQGDGGLLASTHGLRREIPRGQFPDRSQGSRRSPPS